MDNLDCGLSAFKLGFLLGFRSGGKKKQRLPLSSLDESDDFELQQTNISASTCDIACLRQTLGSLPEAIYIAYISNGHAKVKAAINKGTMSAHSWVDTGFDEEAIDVSIAFDGKIGSKKGRAEFITNNRPWVFWVTSLGELYGQILGKSEKYLLSSENCTKVSAIRATYYQNQSDDFGLIVFFIDNGSIYYRQYINGIWYDAIHVDIESRSAVDLAAFRTFDYRVGLQIKTSTGSVIEIFSKYQGIGRNSSEHIEISNIAFNGQLLAVRYLNAKTAEHIEITNIFPSVELIKATPPVIISAQTIDDGAGNYGRFVQVVFDLPLIRSEVAAQPETFEIVDDRGIIFVAIGASANLDQKTVILEFDDFNSAHGQCSLVYTPGTIHGYSGTALLPINFPWTPEHLVPPAVPAPQVISIINVGYSDAGIRRVRYYNGSGQVLLHTEYVNYGEDAAWGSGAEWSNVAEGEPVENILEDIVVDTDVYLASSVPTLKWIETNRSDFSVQLDNYTYDLTDNFELVWSNVSSPRTTGDWPGILGTSISNNATLYTQYNLYSNRRVLNIAYNHQWAGDSNVSFDSPYDYDNCYMLSLVNGDFTIYKGDTPDDITTVAATRHFDIGPSGGNEYLTLFPLNSNYRLDSKFYRLTIYRNGTVIHDYRPIVDGIADIITGESWTVSTSGHINGPPAV